MFNRFKKDKDQDRGRHRYDRPGTVYRGPVPDADGVSEHAAHQGAYTVEETMAYEEGGRHATL